MGSLTIHRFVSWFIGLVWLVNGLWYKVLQMVPRHEQIVARILGAQFSKPITLVIGLLEVFLGLWILLAKKQKALSVIQIGLVLSMNIMEVALARDLLLWGALNLIFALLFCCMVYWYGFQLSEK